MTQRLSPPLSPGLLRINFYALPGPLEESPYLQGHQFFAIVQVRKMCTFWVESPCGVNAWWEACRLNFRPTCNRTPSPLFLHFSSLSSSPTMSSLKFLLHHRHSPLKDRSKCIVVIESISDTSPLLMTGNLARRGLEIGRKPEGGAVRNHLYSAPSRDHTQL